MSSPQTPENAPNPRRSPKWRRRLVRALVVLLVAFIAGELFARFYLGLGDPPLSMFDAEMEYRFKPSMSYRRFGNRIHYNAWSMRSEDFPPHKSSPDELRLMVLGDSVINGGAQTDDSQLATRLLEAQLSRDLHRRVLVGNISAASWGPPNELAYAKKFGLFDADVVVLVESSQDYADVPTFEPVVDVDPSMPSHRPWFALQEAVTRYLWPRLFGSKISASAATAPVSPSQKDIDQSLQALRDLIKLAQERGAKVILAQHLEAEEKLGNEMPGHAMIEAVGRACGVPIVQLGPPFNAARDRGENPWRDNIHPNAAGQSVIALTLRPAIESLVTQARPARGPTTMDSAPAKR